MGLASDGQSFVACSRASRFAAERLTCGARPPWDPQTVAPWMAYFRQRSPVRLLLAMHWRSVEVLLVTETVSLAKDLTSAYDPRSQSMPSLVVLTAQSRIR